jgi:hypothetical protein
MGPCALVERVVDVGIPPVVRVQVSIDRIGDLERKRVEGKRWCARITVRVAMDEKPLDDRLLLVPVLDDDEQVQVVVRRESAEIFPQLR